MCDFTPGSSWTVTYMYATVGHQCKSFNFDHIYRIIAKLDNRHKSKDTAVDHCFNENKNTTIYEHCQLSVRSKTLEIHWKTD